MARRITFPMIRFKQNLNVLIHSRIRILGYVNFVIHEDTERKREGMDLNKSARAEYGAPIWAEITREFYSKIQRKHESSLIWENFGIDFSNYLDLFSILFYAQNCIKEIYKRFRFFEFVNNPFWIII